MARRTLDRRALRDMAEAAGKLGPNDAGTKRTSRSSTNSRSTSRVSAGQRMKMVWMVYDASAKRVATFEYSEKAKADKLATKLTKDKGSTHFVRQVKQPISETV